MRIRVDRDKCIGAGYCVVHAPTVFKLDEEDKAVVLAPTGAGLDEDVLWDVAENCPPWAIILEDDDGRRLFP